MRLVHRHEADGEAPQESRKARQRDPLGRDVEQLELAPRRRAPDGGGFLGVHRAVQAAGGDAAGAQRVHLVLHQRDQRRNDQRESVAGERRKLVAERLAAAGGQEHDRVAPGERRPDGALLERTERVVAEAPPEESAEGVAFRRSVLDAAVPLRDRWRYGAGRGTSPTRAADRTRGAHAGMLRRGERFGGRAVKAVTVVRFARLRRGYRYDLT